jgi:hypothetical protein
MQDSLTTGSTDSRVTALFEGSARCFFLSDGATFEDLAHRVDRLPTGKDDQMVAITLKFWSPARGRDQSARTASRQTLLHEA